MGSCLLSQTAILTAILQQDQCILQFVGAQTSRFSAKMAFPPKIGPREITKLKVWGPSAVGWGGALGLFAVFMTSNWIAEPYLRKVPIYNRKYTNAYKYDNMYGS